MPDSPTSESESNFVCACDDWMRGACVGVPSYQTADRKHYCVIHFPGHEKSAHFKRVFEEKCEQSNFNFRGAWFSAEVSFPQVFPAEVDFRFATFTAPADFRRTTFKSTAYFSGTIFHAEAYFSRARFINEASFRFASFMAEADFRFAAFGTSADFRRAIFKTDVDFSGATFSLRANFSCAAFENYATFGGSTKSAPFGKSSSLILRYAKVEKPDRISFQALALSPKWFVNIDCSKFDFTNVDWIWRNLNEEFADLQREGSVSPHRTLAIAYWNLAVNAEENGRFEQASKFRYLAMDARRLERQRRRGLGRSNWKAFKKILASLSRSLRRDWGLQGRTKKRLERFLHVCWDRLNSLHWLYWLASGYGERAGQAFGVLLCVWFLGAMLYTQVGFARWEPKVTNEADSVVAKKDDEGAALTLGRAFTYSAGVMTLQKPEPRPATTAAQTVVLLETILGPIQAALLALAIRRKFVR